MPSGAASTSWRNGRSEASSDMEHPHHERRTRRAILDPDLSAVSLHRELAERKPEPAIRTRCIRALEALEDLVAQLGRYAWPRIDDAKLETVVGRCDLDAHFAALGRVADRVLDEVREHAVHEIGIDGN